MTKVLSGGSPIDLCPFGDDVLGKQEIVMNTDILKGNWKQFRGKVQQQWGKLTDDDLDVIQGNHEMLVGKLQQRYGWSEDEAKRRFKEFEGRLSPVMAL